MAGGELALVGCGKEAPPESQAIQNREQQAMMISRGVSKLISDSGITRYKFITEEWVVYDKTDPPRQDFLKGILILRYDDNMTVDMQITADTAYCYNQNLWELRGRVFVDNEATKTNYRSEQLYWDMQSHEFYSNVWMHIITPEREIQGTKFRSNEQMTFYQVDNDNGTMPMPKDENKAKKDSAQSTTTQKR